MFNLFRPHSNGITDEEIDNFWYRYFGEHRGDFEDKLRAEEKESWQKELPSLLQRIEKLQEEVRTIEQQLPRRLMLELKSKNQEIYILYSKILYHNRNII